LTKYMSVQAAEIDRYELGDCLVETNPCVEGEGESQRGASPKIDQIMVR
jgi:hypothetical protein